MQDFNYLNKDINMVNSTIYYINRAAITPQVGFDFEIIRNSSYPYCVIHYVTDGIGTVIYKGKEYPLRKGQIFVLNAYNAHCYKTNSKYPLGLNWIEFSGGDCAKLIQAITINSPIFDCPVSTQTNRYMLRIFSLLEKNPIKKSGAFIKNYIFNSLKFTFLK